MLLTNQKIINYKIYINQKETTPFVLFSKDKARKHDL